MKSIHILLPTNIPPTDDDWGVAAAFERDGGTGRAVAASSFHHFVDYNWGPARGCPSFVAEAPGDGYQKDPGALEDVKAYVRNLVLWLRPASS